MDTSLFWWYCVSVFHIFHPLCTTCLQTLWACLHKAVFTDNESRLIGISVLPMVMLWWESLLKVCWRYAHCLEIGIWNVLSLSLCHIRNMTQSIFCICTEVRSLYFYNYSVYLCKNHMYYTILNYEDLKIHWRWLWCTLMSSSENFDFILKAQISMCDRTRYFFLLK